MTSDRTNRQWVLRKAPTATLTDDHFLWREAPVPQLRGGEVLVRNLVVSCDPAQRGWMTMVTYREQIQEGGLIDAFGVGEVISSENPDFVPGQIVEGMLGWQDYAVIQGRELTLRNDDYEPDHLIGLLSITGLTAYFGLFEIGALRAGDTVVISAAAGAVGTIAGQIARIAGCRTIGIAGGEDKCRWLVEELGYDAAVDYRADDLGGRLAAICPEGVDLYFDNAGGYILKAVMANMNMYGRIAACGAMAIGDAGAPSAAEIQGQVIVKRLTLRGFIVLDFLERRAEAERRLHAWAKQGRLRPVVEMHQGLESAPAALMHLLAGGNRGKVAVKVS